MEELVLTDPVVIPSTTTAKYHVISILMDMETRIPPSPDPGCIVINLRDNNNVQSNYQYTGAPAITMIKSLNTANLTTKSMHKRILEKLSADGLLPGTVTGTPDP
jgi:hypothetical protein